MTSNRPEKPEAHVSSARTAIVADPPSANSCALRQRPQKIQRSEHEPRDRDARAAQAMKVGLMHCSSISRPTNIPASTPISNNGPVKNRPVPNRASRVRPTKMPIRVGVTTIQPSTPICARRRPTDGSPSASHRLRRSLCNRALFTSGSVSPGSLTRGSPRVGPRAQMLHDAANGLELQPRAFDMLGSLRLDIGAEPAKNFRIQRRVRVRPATASRVAMAISAPAVTVSTP